MTVRVPWQEVKLEKEVKREQKRAKILAKRAQSLDAECGFAAVCTSLATSACKLPMAVAVPFGSPMPMSELQSPLPLVPVPPGLSAV